jgi:phosphate transport system substrate-binding protein
MNKLYYNNIVLGLVIFIILFNACSSVPNKNAEIIKIKGSDTMFGLTTALAEEFMKTHNYISVYVEGGGTKEGIDALIKGQVDIAIASRLPSGNETKLLADYYGSVGIFYLIAKDGIIIYLNKENKVANLSFIQLQNIFNGTITNWSEVGGNNSAITVINRPPSSGTHVYFKEHVLTDGNYTKNAVTKYTTQSVIKEVKNNVNAIGYGGFGFINDDDVKYALVNNIPPTEENIRNDTYPLTRYLHFFTARTATGATKIFIDWVLSPEGQKIIKKLGFVPLWEVEF